MTKTEIITTLVTFLAVCIISMIFTLLFHIYKKSFCKEIAQGDRDIEIIDEAILQKNKKPKHTGKIIKNIIYILFLIFIIPVFVVSIVNKFNGGKMVLGSKTTMVVLTGSMSYKNDKNTYLVENDLNNQFNTNDIIVVSKVKSSNDLKLYDVIAFKNDKGVNIIHRIIAINEVDGNTYFTTQGDANDSADSYKPVFSDIIGRYNSFHISHIGTFILFLQSPSGISTIIFLIYVVLMTDYMLDKMRKCEEERKKKMIDLIDFFKDDYKLDDNTNLLINYKGVNYYFDNLNLIKKEDINQSESNILVKSIIDINGQIINKEEIQVEGEEDER